MKWPFQRWLESKTSILNGMDPSRIYVENVRALLGINHKAAEWLCEKACRDGLLEHWVSLENPELGRSLAEFPIQKPLRSEEILDEVAEQLGQKSRFRPEELRRVDFYRGTA
ncbi:MAG TPA: hypothetical protein VK717_11330 [Opitutaceae bacterium]|jgi:hypothetical protein|nr:hypothetical protein [Opitutaceae bacterium]